MAVMARVGSWIAADTSPSLRSSEMVSDRSAECLGISVGD
jgi:hypothetical protein